MEKTSRRDWNPLAVVVAALITGGLGYQGVLEVLEHQGRRSTPEQAAQERADLLQKEVEELRAQLLSREREIKALRGSAANASGGSGEADDSAAMAPSPARRVVEVSSFSYSVAACLLDSRSRCLKSGIQGTATPVTYRTPLPGWVSIEGAGCAASLVADVQVARAV